MYLSGDVRKDCGKTDRCPYDMNSDCTDQIAQKDKVINDMVERTENKLFEEPNCKCVQ